MRVVAIIPALDEEATVGDVVCGLRRVGADRVVVVDNGSSDRTAARAAAAGAVIVAESRRGYGAACHAGLAAARDADLIVFADADGSDDPADVPRLLAPLRRGEADLAIGSRVRRASSGALTTAQRLGNWLAGRLLSRWFGLPSTDLGPLRAIRAEALARIGMRDRGFGWTVEMQARAAQLGLRVVEVDVAYRPRRGGRSKISGTVRGSARAGVTILWTLLTVRVRS
jgi:glycosyltransferase involved in cell wall biosynthesis